MHLNLTARDVKETTSVDVLLRVSESFVCHHEDVVFVQNPVFYTGHGAYKRGENGPGAAAVQSVNVMDGGRVIVSCLPHMRTLMVVYISGVSAEYQVCTIVAYYVTGFFFVSSDLN